MPKRLNLPQMSEMVPPTGNESSGGVSANFRGNTATGSLQRACSTEMWLSIPIKALRKGRVFWGGSAGVNYGVNYHEALGCWQPYRRLCFSICDIRIEPGSRRWLLRVRLAQPPS